MVTGARVVSARATWQSKVRFFVAALLWMTTQGKELAVDNFEAKGT